MTENHLKQKKRQHKQNISDIKLLDKSPENIDFFLQLNDCNHTPKNCINIFHLNIHEQSVPIVKDIQKEFIIHSMLEGTDMDIRLTKQEGVKAYFPVLSITAKKDTLSVFMGQVVEEIKELLMDTISKKNRTANFE